MQSVVKITQKTQRKTFGTPPNVTEVIQARYRPRVSTCMFTCYRISQDRSYGSDLDLRLGVFPLLVKVGRGETGPTNQASGCSQPDALLLLKQHYVVFIFNLK